jgi:hypothetical protein
VLITGGGTGGVFPDAGIFDDVEIGNSVEITGKTEVFITFDVVETLEGAADVIGDLPLFDMTILTNADGPEIS